MQTCPKCFKQNPKEAAFCGFCGAEQQMEQTVAKTMFGGLAAHLPAAPAPAAPNQTAPAPDPAASAPAAQVLGGRYVLGAETGHLNVGVCHQGVDNQTQQPVEILVVDGAIFPSPLDMERARREMRQLQSVDCAALLKILDHGKTDGGQLYVVTSPFDGVTVAERVSQAPLSLIEGQNVIREVGTALAEAQKVGVIHRDIAPHNVLCGADGSIKVRGFGLAPTIKRHVFGTPAYISPEQAAGRPVDQRSNIYGLGALMYYLLTGAPPFSGSVEELLEKHQKDTPPALSSRIQGISPRVEQLVSKAMEKSSSRRHLTLRQFLREVDSLAVASGNQPPAPKQPASFETPLHGMTALTGGDRPPSSEVPAVSPPGTSPPGTSPPAAATVPSTASFGAGGPAETAPAPQTVLSPPAPAAQQIDLSKTVTPDGGAVVGELSGGSRVSMRQSSEVAAVKPEESAADKKAPAAGGRPQFRETMWFFKGEVESAMAEEGETAESPPPEENPDLAVKYADDGSMSADEARRLSLRTGKTQMMQAVHVPSGKVPGKGMQADEFIKEMNPGRKIAMIVGIVLALVTVATVLYFVL